MHNKSKSHHPNPQSKGEEPRKYMDFIGERRKILAHISVENQQQPSLSLSQIGKISPILYTNRAIATDRRDASLVGISIKKQQIKEKIKDRIKAEIHNLISRNTFKLKKIDPARQAKECHPSESVSIVGSSLPRPFSRGEIQKQTKNFKRSILLSELVMSSRKVKSSLGGRQTPSEPEKIRGKGSAAAGYRRSMSTDIRVKNIVRRKASEVEQKKKSDRNKEDALQPWIIASFVEEQQNF